MRDLIKTIVVNRANLEHIAKTGNINGTLLIEIERVCEEYHNQQCNMHGVSRSAKVRICEPFEVEETGEKYKVEINHFVDKNGLWEKETVIVKVD